MKKKMSSPVWKLHAIHFHLPHKKEVMVGKIYTDSTRESSYFKAMTTN